MTFDIPSDEIGFDTDGDIAFEAIDTSSDFAASQDSPGLSIEGSGGWEVGEYIRARDSEYPDYDGQTTVIPRADTSTVLETQNKVVRDNITVTEVPYWETSNDSGGLTVYIATEA